MTKELENVIEQPNEIHVKGISNNNPSSSSSLSSVRKERLSFESIKKTPPQLPIPWNQYKTTKENPKPFKPDKIAARVQLLNGSSPSGTSLAPPPPADPPTKGRCSAAIDELLNDIDKRMSHSTIKGEPICVVVAQFDYDAAKTDELSFSRGDVINVVLRDDKDWWKGELHGIQGWFPSNHVIICGGEEGKETARNNSRHMIDKTDSTKKKADSMTQHIGGDNITVVARVEHSFESPEIDELTLLEGELVIVTNQEDDDWWEGKIQGDVYGAEGWFPANHVRVCGSSLYEGAVVTNSIYSENWENSATGWERHYSASSTECTRPSTGSPDVITNVLVSGFEKRTQPKFYVYVIQVTRASGTTVIYRRYSDFYHFHEQLVAKFTDCVFPSFPGKIFLARSHIRKVTLQRQQDLNAFLRGVMAMDDRISQSEVTHSFLRQYLFDLYDH